MWLELVNARNRLPGGGVSDLFGRWQPLRVLAAFPGIALAKSPSKSC